MKKVITILTITCALIAFINAFSSYFLLLFLAKKFNVDTRKAGSIGIIGGADGPTAIFMSGHTSKRLITVIFGILAILGVIYLVITKFRK